MARFSGSIPPAGAGFRFADRGVASDAGLLPLCRDIEILPRFADRRMVLLAEGDAVERVDHGHAIPLDDASDLRALGFGAGKAIQRFRQAKFGGMAGRGRIDGLDSEGEFAFAAVVGAALFGAATGENTPRYAEGKDPAVSEIGGHDRRLAIIELGAAGLGIGADEGLP